MPAQQSQERPEIQMNQVVEISEQTRSKKITNTVDIFTAEAWMNRVTPKKWNDREEQKTA